MQTTPVVQEQNHPDSPQFSFMRDLDDIVPPEDMFLEKEQPPQEEETQGSTETEESTKKKNKKRKKKTFKSGDKDMKFDSYNGRRDNDKALVFIRQFY